MYITVSIHAPRVGSDIDADAQVAEALAFQSTLPAWGATPGARQSCSHQRFQSTLPAWGATKLHQRSKLRCSRFNPRSPRGERPSSPEISPMKLVFQSTLPAWGATRRRRRRRWCRSGFNPRSPRGERQVSVRQLLGSRHVSIHAPRVGSDGSRRSSYPRSAPVSIHAPRVGSDFLKFRHRPAPWEFQSTLPAWGATGSASTASADRCCFNPRSPRGERRG